MTPAAPRTFFVTGATSGIGEATACQLAAKGHRVLIGARNQERGVAAQQRIAAAVPGAITSVIVGDLSDMAQVREVAQDVTRQVKRLDGLILNAGVALPSRQLSADGFESTFATNYLAPFLLSQLLLPALRGASPASVVVVASSDHRGIKRFDFDDRVQGTNYRFTTAYATSKLFTIYFASELARRLDRSNVVPSAADPGWVRTALGRRAKGAFRLFLKAARVLQSSPQEGARTSVYLATCPQELPTPGGYYTKCTPGVISDLAKDPVRAREVWDCTANLLIRRGLAAPDELL